ncbi:MAG: sulfatase-like hydrolase/transferase [Alphaproteobacteria bacterium]|nr:sulfatase-like hydrolase/transferase [Alphaproteobacteria bacterium]
MLAWVVLLWGCGAPSPEVEPTPELSVAPVPVEAPVPPEPEEPLPRGGNVLVLLIDDVGVDKVGAYGGGYAARTPRIDALASQGIRFTNAYAAPMCSPSRAILLTGRYGRRTGIGTITEKESNGSELPLDAVTIPEALDFATGATWTNAAIGKWHLAGPAAADWKTHPNRQGFDWFVGTRGNPEYKEGRGYFHWHAT